MGYIYESLTLCRVVGLLFFDINPITTIVVASKDLAHGPQTIHT